MPRGVPRCHRTSVVREVKSQVGSLDGTSDADCPSLAGLSQPEEFTYDAAQRLTGHDVVEGGVHASAFTCIHDPASRLVERHEGIGNTWLRYGLPNDGRLESLERESPSPPYLPRIDREELELDDLARPRHVKRYRAGGGPPGPVQLPHWTIAQRPAPPQAKRPPRTASASARLVAGSTRTPPSSA